MARKPRVLRAPRLFARFGCPFVKGSAAPSSPGLFCDLPSLFKSAATQETTAFGTSQGGGRTSPTSFSKISCFGYPPSKGNAELSSSGLYCDFPSFVMSAASQRTTGFGAFLGGDCPLFLVLFARVVGHTAPRPRARA